MPNPALTISPLVPNTPPHARQQGCLLQLVSPLYGYGRAPGALHTNR